MLFGTRQYQKPTRYQSFELPWTPVRPPRSEETIRTLLERHWQSDTLHTSFSYEDRVAVHRLLSLVVSDKTMQELVDGFVLPPPYRLPTYAELRAAAPTDSTVQSSVAYEYPSRHTLRIAVEKVNPSLDVLLPLIPFNIGISIGFYDARLRAAARRLCWLLGLPFELVERQEAGVSEAHNTAAVTLQYSGRLTSEQVKEKADAIKIAKRSQLASLKRAVRIGGFALLGSGIVVTGGVLSAPLLAPAYASLVAGVSTTIHSIGTVGSYVLGTGAVAAVFAGAAGAVAQCVGTAGVLTPLITTANVAAVFGLGGAVIGGRKGYRRTNGVDVFKIRSVNDVERFRTGPHDAAVETLLALTAQTTQTANSAMAGSALATPFDLANVVEDDSAPGIVVPSYTRYIAMGHVAKVKSIKKRFSQVVFALDSQLTGFELRCKAIKLVAGVWGLAPPAVIASGHSGICACMNRFAQPTGAGLVLCYEAVSVSTTAGRSPFRLWVRAYSDLFGQWELSSYVENLDRPLDPINSEVVLSSNRSTGSYTRTQDGVTMELHTKPFVYLKVYLTDAMSVNFQRVVFPLVELNQVAQEYAKELLARRRVGIAFVNKSRHTVAIRETHVLVGVRWSKTATPRRIDPKEASLTMFCNKPWTLDGVQGYYLLEVRNNSDDPRVKRYFLRLDFSVKGRSQTLLAAALAGPNAMQLKTCCSACVPIPKKGTTVLLEKGLFFDAALSADPKTSVVQLIISNDVESKAPARATQETASPPRATLTFGICGFISIFDPRRAASDQQVALWQPVMSSAALLGLSDDYVVHWEDNYLTQFADSVDIDLNLKMADRVSKKTFKKVTKAVRKQIEQQLLQSVVFSGFRAYKSLLGAFNVPLYAVWAADVIDNAFAVLSNRAVYAGKDLAVALLDEARGRRPVSLVGFSFGAKVIVECLSELERVDALSVVENVYLLGGTFPADPALWQRLRRVVAGRLVNVYTRHDWALWMMYKANDVNMKPMAGITAVNVPGVENVDLTPLVLQHSEYASRLADVLDAIPARPTEETWNPKNRLGSPGVVVPSRKVDAAVANIGASLGSLLSSTPFCGFAVRNHVLSDMPEFAPELELCGHLSLHCFFDFTPRDVVSTGTAGCFGVVGNTDDTAMGGVVAYRLTMPEWSDRTLLIIVHFYAEKNGEVLVAVQPNLITARVRGDETQEAMLERATTIVTQTVTSLEDVQRVCRRNGTRDGSVSTEVPLVTSPFSDRHRSAPVHLSWRKTKGGVVLTVLALFLKDASELQQARMTEASFNKEYLPALEAAAPAESDPSEAEDKQADPPTLMAPVLPMEDLHAQLHSTVKRFASPSKLTADTSASATVSTASARLAPVPIAIVNCGDIPVFFATDVYYRSLAEAASAACVGDAASSESPPVNQEVQWVLFPPPEIPPRSVTVMVVRSLTDGQFLPDIRYRTAKEECGFAISSLHVDTVVNDSTTSATRTIHCVPDPACTLQAEASATSMTVDGMTCFIAIITPVGPPDSGKDHNLTSTDVKEGLREYGWVIF